MTEKEISQQITRYINGELSDTEEDLLWESFLENREYYRLFETELHLADLYRHKKFRLDESGQTAGKDISTHRNTVWTASVAAVLMLTFMIYVFYPSNQEPASAFALQEIDVTEMLGSDAFRDVAPEPNAINRQINRSLAMAFADQSDQAYSTLNGLLPMAENSLQQAKILYNLGILSYNREDYDLSISHFSELNSETFDDLPRYVSKNADWYLANAYLMLDETEEAVRILDRLSTGTGNLASDASDLLEKVQN